LYNKKKEEIENAPMSQCFKTTSNCVKTTDTNYATRKSKENFANNNSNSVVLQSNAHRHA